MHKKDYVNKVEIENIYKTIVDLEGEKHPIDSFESLESAKEYIVEKLESYGVEVELHQFYLEDFDYPFTNIIGHIGNKEEPSVLIGSHYDSVRGTPGANDNLSAVAVSLEVARVLCSMENPPSVKIAVFTLEEGHPTNRLWIDKALRNKGWLDKENKFTTAKMLQFSKKLQGHLLKKYRKEIKPYLEILEDVYFERKNEFTEEELSYIDTLKMVYTQIENLDNPDMLSKYLVGSSRYAVKAQEEGTPIKSVIVYDCLGWVSDEEGTQKPLPISEQLYPFTRLHKTEHKSTIGNYIAVVASQNSSEQLNKFLVNCKDPSVDIPYYGLHLPFDYQTIHNQARDMLRSDHAPFWELGIPGIFISDTANFRSPFYHTGEDKSNRINYEFLTKIAQVTLKTLL